MKWFKKTDINALLKEVRKLYSQYVERYSKNSSVLQAFEDRYYAALKSRRNLESFLNEEKKAAEELFTKESNRFNTEYIETQEDEIQQSWDEGSAKSEDTEGSSEEEAYDNLDSLEQAEPLGRGSGEKTGGQGAGRSGDMKQKGPTAHDVQGTGKSANFSGKSNGKQDFADRVMAEHRERIEHYPDAYLHEDASHEMEKLSGALMDFGDRFWYPVEDALRKNGHILKDEDVSSIQAEGYRFCVSGRHDYPPALERYVLLVSRLHRDQREIDIEEKRCLTDTALFLYKIIIILYKIRKRGSLSDSERKIIEDAVGYAEGCMYNFRLKDLTRMNRR